MAQHRRHLKAFFWGVLALFALLPALGARSQGEKETARTFHALALSPSPAFAELFHLRAPGDAVPLEIATHRIGSRPMVAGAGPIVLAVRTQDAQGKAAFSPVAKVDWPQGATADRALLFVAAKGSGRDLKVQAVAVDNSFEVFPPRSLRVINFSGAPVLAQFGDFRGELAPGPARAVAYPNVPSPAGGGVGRFAVALAQSPSPGEPAKILFNGWTEAWQEARTLLLVTPGIEGGRSQVRLLVDPQRSEQSK
jgi:hypothetical protein